VKIRRRQHPGVLHGDPCFCARATENLRAEQRGEYVDTIGENCVKVTAAARAK